MKQRLFLKKELWIVLIPILLSICLPAQNLDCSFKPPVFTLDFGEDGNEAATDLSGLKNYRRTKKYCPDDGQFSIISYSSGCFGNKWISLYKDHTAGSVNGRMLLVNASVRPGAFFVTNAGGLKPNTTYELAAWFVNVCRYGEGCTPTPPVINITIKTNTGVSLARFQTGALNPTGSATWQRYFGTFTTPAGETAIQVLMEDITTGGCGNDFAMDDISIRECVMKTIEKKQPPKTEQPVAKKIAAPATRPVIKPAAPEPVAPKKSEATFSKEPVKKQAVTVSKEMKIKKPDVPVPDVILKRENPVVKKIESAESFITVDLYDNGQIDGDTVTIYHNNQLVVAHAGLSEKAISFKIKVDKNEPHHELVMVADNLGGIPPNTSVMVLTAADKRYEVFISSTEQKNARVVIDLKTDEAK
jgi:hypothetical protein